VYIIYSSFVHMRVFFSYYLLYQVARITELDYYQAMKRIEELSRNQFINVRNGNISITERGIELMQILERLIFLMHADNPESNNILG